MTMSDNDAIAYELRSAERHVEHTIDELNLAMMFAERSWKNDIDMMRLLKAKSALADAYKIIVHEYETAKYKADKEQNND